MCIDSWLHRQLIGGAWGSRCPPGRAIPAANTAGGFCGRSAAPFLPLPTSAGAHQPRCPSLRRRQSVTYGWLLFRKVESHLENGRRVLSQQVLISEVAGIRRLLWEIFFMSTYQHQLMAADSDIQGPGLLYLWNFASRKPWCKWLMGLSQEEHFPFNDNASSPTEQECPGS